ncbi:hypothetical protein TWF106_008028 [Orbilia oligospora]|uniref:Gem-associated protein 5 TPR domain-containing protein n=1 Tax=Orbilia oligospora TaxID=2813651 RepID=A0A6G1MMI8_ORBOL|nr:hypothetical protein TWF788_007213 [Orbilia oligospora]KAF3217190.1 hypothetical protein TWF106_008028 [Orbilia oligospora]KAF3219937.1 hypothetical protein TWF679_010394 [Orbilia oligospora]KAF3221581.1 hypothetical protein TWF191_007083 [Orbilia oligospora]KAF3264307.1 hypothetical protein TWF192_003996 [Orbilia oligospora]
MADKPLMSLAPCASTSSLFIFAQGSSIACVKHDTLQLERRFEAHAADITLIAADTSAETGDGQVISLDVSKEAVVWDSGSGEEISRFTAYEEIRVATFLRNGTIALGDNMGNIILFDPVRSEAVSCRTFQMPICALAPSADSKFFAIGYQNGTVIIATLMPTFVIHHTLANGNASSFPVTVLAWHGSSSRQKSDMLATQSNDGDLKVWSIAKPIDGGEVARVVRVLKKPDAYPSRRNWMAWSRNGRILQYSDYDTSIWDVRTKKVAWEAVMSKSNVLALSVYGPKGLMFTIDRHQNVQQYNLYPPQMVANVQHLPANAPPSPPMSVSHDNSRPNSNRKTEMERTESQRSVAMERSDSKASKFSQDARAIAAMKRDETRTPLGQIAHELEMLEELEKSHLKSSNMARSDSMQSSGTGISHHQKSASVASSIKSYTSGTGASDTTSLASPRGFDDMATPRRFHPLSQEIGMSPITPKAPSDALQPVPYAQRNVNGDPLPTPGLPPSNGDFYDEQLYMVPPVGQLELFPNLKDKLAGITYRTPMHTDRARYDDERRREMFSSVFGFEGDAEALIREEIAQHPARSLQSLMLRLWLHDLDANALNVLMGSETLVPSDWLFIALSAMGGQKSWQQTVRVFIMRLIQKGDVHNAVMCFLMIGERDQAIEHYVSNKKYMEAVLLTALMYKEWRRLSILVRKWGEHAAENNEGSLAMRCFAITENIPDPVPTPAPTTGNHSRKSSLSGSIKSPTSPQKAQNVLSKPERPISPRVGSSVRNTAARLFGFGDKDKEKKHTNSNEANIMDMPWNRPIDEQRNQPQPSRINTDVTPGTGAEAVDKKEMIISGPINTTPVDGRIGTPALQRVASPGFPAPGRVGSPALSMHNTNNLPVRTISPKPPSIVDRTASPRPTITGSQLPQRIESPGPERMASPSPAPSMAVSNYGPSRVASPAQDGGLAVPQRTGSALSQRKPPGLHIQLSSFHDVLASEPSPELIRTHPKGPLHQANRSVSKLHEVEVPEEDEIPPPPPMPTRKASLSQASKPIQKSPPPQVPAPQIRRYDDSPEEDYDIRAQSSVQPVRRNTVNNNNSNSRHQQQSHHRRQESEKDQSFAEDSYDDDDDSAQEEAERNLEARRRSLERLEQEMENVRLQRARSITRQRDTDNTSRGGVRRVKSPEQTKGGTIRAKPRQQHQPVDFTTEEEYSEEERSKPAPRKVYGGYDTSEVSEVSEVDERYYNQRTSTRPPVGRVPSRTQNRTPRVASRNGHRAPPARVPSRNQARTPARYREETEEDEEEEYAPRRVLSRTQNRTPKPRAYEADRAMSPPQRGASRNTNKTPRPRYEEFTEEDEEELPRHRKKTPAPRQHEEFTESEADDFRAPQRQPSRNQIRPQRYAIEAESEYEILQPPSRSASRAGPPRSKTPLSALNNKPPSRTTTPSGGHRRAPSVSRNEPPLPTSAVANIAKATSPVPDYDRHDYDLPALAAAAAAAKNTSPPPERKNSILDNDRKPSHPQILRAKLNTLPAIPQSPMGLPADLPTHPAFAGNMRATTGLARKPAAPKSDDIRTQTVSIQGNGGPMISPGKQALRMHTGPGGDDMITVGLEGVVMDDGGAPVEAAPPPKAGRATPMGQKI